MCVYANWTSADDAPPPLLPWTVRQCVRRIKPILLLKDTVKRVTVLHEIRVTDDMDTPYVTSKH